MWLGVSKRVTRPSHSISSHSTYRLFLLPPIPPISIARLFICLSLGWIWTAGLITFRQSLCAIRGEMKVTFKEGFQSSPLAPSSRYYQPILLLKSVTLLVFCPISGSLYSPNSCLSVSWSFPPSPPRPPFFSAPGSVIA